MIPTKQEIIYRVIGALYLARFNPRGVQYFEESPAAALRSFFAAAIVAPAFAIVVLLSVGDLQAEDPVPIFAVFLLQYVLIWTVYPVIAYRICESIGREKAFFRYLAADNWTSVVGHHLQLAAVVLVAGGMLPEGLDTLLNLALRAYLLGLSWYIARNCLDISTPAAVGFVVLQLFIWIALNLVVGSILYPAAG